MARKIRPYQVGLHERLKDLSHAVNYIKAAAEDSIEGFLLALRDFAEATQGMSKIAASSEKNRENLYRMLSEDGNPRLNSLWPVLEAMGLRLSVEPIEANTSPSSDRPDDEDELNAGEITSRLGSELTQNSIKGIHLVGAPAQAPATKRPQATAQDIYAAASLSSATGTSNRI